MNKEYKSYAKIYWILWFIFYSVFFLGKIFKIYLLKDIPFDIYWFVVGLILILITLVVNWKLENYLQKNYSEKWNELTTIPGYGSGYTYRSQYAKFLFSKDTLNDPIIAKLKNELKSILLLVITHFFSIIVIPVLLILVRLWLKSVII